MWISKVQMEESREVTLELGKGKGKRMLKEQTAFLAEISEYFEALFYSDFAERNKDLIKIEHCDAERLRTIIVQLRFGKRDNSSIEEVIAYVVNPDFYPTITYFMIRVDNLHAIIMHTMDFKQISDYANLAKETGDVELAQATFYKSLGCFYDFRRTTMFKKKSLAGLKKYLSSKYLEYETEKQILEAVLWWLNFNFRIREQHLEEALALINWRKIKANQLKFLLKMKITKKSFKLQQIFAELYISETAGLTGVVLVNELDRQLLSNIPEREKRPFIISLPIQYKLIDENNRESFKIGVVFYDVQERKMLETYIVHPEPLDEVRQGYHFELLNFEVCLFGKYGPNNCTTYTCERHAIINGPGEDVWWIEDRFFQGVEIARSQFTDATAEYRQQVTTIIKTRAPVHLPPTPQFEEFVNNGHNILVSVEKYGTMFYLGAKDIHQFDMLQINDENPILETVSKVQEPSRMLIKSGKIYRFDMKNQISVYNMQNERVKFFHPGNDGTRMPYNFDPDYLMPGKDKDEFFMTAKGKSSIYRVRLTNGTILFRHERSFIFHLPGTLIWQCKFDGKYWLLIKVSKNRDDSRLILANFCPILKTLVHTYELSDLNKDIAKLLSANSIETLPDENLLRLSDDVKAINPLWLKMKVEDFDELPKQS